MMQVFAPSYAHVTICDEEDREFEIEFDPRQLTIWDLLPKSFGGYVTCDRDQYEPEILR